MKLNELMDKAKSRANLPSDYALAKALGIKTGIISNWRKGKRHPSTEEAIQLATLAGLEEMPVIAAIEYEAATTEKKKQFWKCYLEQHGIAAGLCMITLGISILLTPEPAQANVLQLQNYDAHNSVKSLKGIYIMRIQEGGWRNSSRNSFAFYISAISGRSPDCIPLDQESGLFSICCISFSSKCTINDLSLAGLTGLFSK